MLLSLTELILAQFDLPGIDQVEYLGGAGGFSGAQLWKIKTADSKDLCLRRWPSPHPNSERLEWINLVLTHVAANGCDVIPVPFSSRQGSKFVQQGEFLWEVASWMPGAADFSSNGGESRLRNAVRALARFHLASAQVNLDFRLSPNAQSRVGSLLRAEPLLVQIGQAENSNDYPGVNFLRELVLKKGPEELKLLADSLSPFSTEILPVQPVIRDVWHDHILFTGDEVTGIVDFGAMQMDNVALDLARLLGSLVPDQPEQWELAIRAYSELRPLQPREIKFALELDRSATYLGSLNWLKWILVEGRCFESVSAVEQRVAKLISRLAS